MIDDALLGTLMTEEATSGDEGRLVERLADLLAGYGVERTMRVGNTLIAVKGKPTLAVLAHIDSIGFTLGYDNRLIPVGGPNVTDGVAIRATVGDRVFRGRVRVEDEDDHEYRLVEGEGPPATRWVYDTVPALGTKALQGAYLDNRFGVYTGLHLLRLHDDVLVAFTASEEASGRGALDAGRWVYENTTIRRALIADITWATKYVKPGKGPAVSFRDAFLPRKAWFDQVRQAAERSGIKHQIEIESAGSSDGGMLERSGYGIDWLFVGAPENGYHTATESLQREDAENMLRLYDALIASLT
jgi:putative aminopeptidase FrvX